MFSKSFSDTISKRLNNTPLDSIFEPLSNRLNKQVSTNDPYESPTFDLPLNIKTALTGYTLPDNLNSVDKFILHIFNFVTPKLTPTQQALQEKVQLILNEAFVSLRPTISFSSCHTNCYLISTQLITSLPANVLDYMIDKEQENSLETRKKITTVLCALNVFKDFCKGEFSTVETSFDNSTNRKKSSDLPVPKSIRLDMPSRLHSTRPTHTVQNITTARKRTNNKILVNDY